MGCGFTLAMVLIGVIRELFGSGTIFEITILGSWYNPALVFILPPGAFIVIGYLIGIMKLFDERKIRFKAKGGEN